MHEQDGRDWVRKVREGRRKGRETRFELIWTEE